MREKYLYLLFDVVGAVSLLRLRPMTLSGGQALQWYAFGAHCRDAVKVGDD